MAQCALCLKDRALKKSHILPNAIFRRVKQKSSGQLIAFDDSDASYVHHSQSSYSERLLCSDCEKIIRDYETYSFRLLRGAKEFEVHKSTEGITFKNHDYHTFKLFLTSIIWRAAISTQDFFANLRLSSDLQEAARLSIYKSKPLGPFELGCKLARLIDKTTASDGGFTNENLKLFVISPILRHKSDNNYFSSLFLFEGFLFEFFIPRLPMKNRKELGVHKKSKVLFAPYKNIFSVPELVKIMLAGYGKNIHGLTTLKKK